MNGKKLKVLEYELSFGKQDRIVNVFGVFRYKKNNGLYILYSDVGNTYPVIYYGSSHIKDHSVLSMGTKDNDVEIIKEYIFKVVNGEELDGFEIISLEDIDSIEIISSLRLEVKADILLSLVDKTIPKIVQEEVKREVVNKKKGFFSKIIMIFLVAFLIGGMFYYFSSFGNKDKNVKMITCTKVLSNRDVNASVEENIVLYFDYQDVLERMETVQVFAFKTEGDYQDFINKGGIYKYMPDDDNGGYKQDDENYRFTFIINRDIDGSEQIPVKYEEVFSYYNGEGYKCDDKIAGE